MALPTNDRPKRFYLGKGTAYQREWTAHIDPVLDHRVVYTREKRNKKDTGVPRHCDFTNALMPVTILENKTDFCRISHGCAFSPRVYFDYTDLQKVNADHLVIVKPNNGGEGKGIRICRAAELTPTDFHGKNVQELLTDAALYDGRKFHVRTMFLYCPRQRAYLLWNGMLLDSPVKYEEASTTSANLNMHITNRSFHYVRGARDMSSPTFHDWPQHTHYLDAMRNLGQELFACLEQHVRVTDPSKRYDLYGLDVMLLADGSCKLLEVNTYWCMFPDPTLVNMVKNAFRLLAGDHTPVHQVFSYFKK